MKFINLYFWLAFQVILMQTKDWELLLYRKIIHLKKRDVILLSYMYISIFTHLNFRLNVLLILADSLPVGFIIWWCSKFIFLRLISKTACVHWFSCWMQSFLFHFTCLFFIERVQHRKISKYWYNLLQQNLPTFYISKRIPILLS